MAEAARHGRREQFGYAVRRAEFFPGGEEGPPSHQGQLRRRRRRLSFGPMGHLLGPPLVKGNKITPLENGDQIFPAMLSGIRSAQRTITFENFLCKEGEVSDAFAASTGGTRACRRKSAFPAGCDRDATRCTDAPSS